jgi:hypothetical protein
MALALEVLLGSIGDFLLDLSDHNSLDLAGALLQLTITVP